VLTDTVSAVVLAGGQASEELMAATGHANRALIQIGDLSMLDLVVKALVMAKTVGEIVVVGDVPKSGDYRIVPAKGDLFENLSAGIESFGPSDGGSILVSTSDIPFITPQAIDDFVVQSQRRNAHICYPIVPMDIYNEKFAGMKRTTLKLREGKFTGGNVMLIDGGFAARHGDQIRQAYNARKEVLKLGAMLGPKILFRILLSQTLAPNLLDLAMLEDAVSRLLSGAHVAAIITQFAEIGTDVDKVADVEYARQHFGE